MLQQHNLLVDTILILQCTNLSHDMHLHDVTWFHLLQSRHSNIALGANHILGLPQTRHGLPLRVEPQTVLSIEVTCPSSSNRLLVSSEGEHRQRHRNRHVNTQLAGLHLLLEARRGRAGSCEDSCTVTVGVVVDQLDRFVDGLDVHTNDDGAKDLFRVAFHVGFHVCYHGGTNLEAVSILAVE